MKTVSILFLAVLAMAYAHDKVKVVEQSSGQSLNIVPDSSFYQPSNGPGQIVITNPDPGFYRPSVHPGQQQPSVGPTFVNNGNVATQAPYPYKKYDNPYARGGK